MAALHPFLVGNRSPNPWPWRIIRPTKTAARPSLKEFYWTGSNMVLKMCSNKIHTRFFAMTSFLFKDVNSIQRVLSLPVFVLSMFHCFFWGKSARYHFCIHFCIAPTLSGMPSHGESCFLVVTRHPTEHPHWFHESYMVWGVLGLDFGTFWCGAVWCSWRLMRKEPNNHWSKR